MNTAKLAAPAAYVVHLHANGKDWYLRAAEKGKEAHFVAIMTRATRYRTFKRAELASRGVKARHSQLRGWNVSPMPTWLPASIRAHRNPSKRMTRAERMRKLSAAVAKAAAGSAYNKSKRRPRKPMYIARGASLAASNQFRKMAAKLHLNPDARPYPGYSLAGIKGHNRAAGLHFFDSGAMSMFGTKVDTVVYPNEATGYTYFVTSEQDTDGMGTGDKHGRAWGGERRYTVRRFNWQNARIETVGEFGQYRTKGDARAAAKVHM